MSSILIILLFCIINPISSFLGHSDRHSGACSAISPSKHSKSIKYPLLKGAISPSRSLSATELSEMNNNEARNEKNIRDLILKEANYDINDPDKTLKRKNYISWNEYFIAIATLSAQRSKDPHAPLGACIVDDDNRIVGIGYNGFPRGCSDDCLPWASSVENCSNLPPLHSKDFYVVYAEVNALLNKTNTVKGARMYVLMCPGNESAKMIIQAGISEVIYTKMDSDNSDSARACRIMFQMAGVKLTEYIPTHTNPMAPLDFSMFGAPTSIDDKDYQKKADLAISKHRDLLMKEANYDPKNAFLSKREGYLSWDDYFTAVAYLSSRRSKDPNTQVGACIVDSNKCIIGIGYNGFPRGCSDDHLPWARNAKANLHNKYLYVVHAEVNAILNTGSKNVKGATLYVALFPCNECAKVIIQSGIQEVVYLKDKYHDSDECRASRIMFDMAGVKYRQHVPSQTQIHIDFNSELDDVYQSPKQRELA